MWYYVRYMLYPINEIAVITSALLTLSIGSIWYSPVLFGNIWARGTQMASPAGQLSQKTIVRLVILATLVNLVVLFVIAEFIEVAKAYGFSVWIPAALLILYVLAQLLQFVIWEKKPISYFLVHAGYSIIVICGGVLVIGWWPW